MSAAARRGRAHAYDWFGRNGRQEPERKASAGGDGAYLEDPRPSLREAVGPEAAAGHYDSNEFPTAGSSHETSPTEYPTIHRSRPASPHRTVFRSNNRHPGYDHEERGIHVPVGPKGRGVRWDDHRTASPGYSMRYYSNADEAGRRGGATGSYRGRSFYPTSRTYIVPKGESRTRCSAFPLSVLSVPRSRGRVIHHRLIHEGFSCRVSRTRKHVSSAIGSSRDMVADWRA